MTTLAILAAMPEYATDENGFLYKMQAGGVAKPLRPRIARFGSAQHVCFLVKKGKKTIQFNQDVLKEMQHKAIGRIVG